MLKPLCTKKVYDIIQLLQRLNCYFVTEMSRVEQRRPRNETSVLVEAQPCQTSDPSAFIQL